MKVNFEYTKDEYKKYLLRSRRINNIVLFIIGVAIYLYFSLNKISLIYLPLFMIGIKDKIENIGFVCGVLGFAFLVSSSGYIPYIIIGVAGLVAGVAICCSSESISDKFGILAAKLNYNASVVLNKIETIEVNHVDNVENTETHNQTLLLGQA